MGKGRGPKDPFGTYIEWADHRYDPGHYLGGNIPPHLSKSALGPRAQRLSGILLIASGLIGFACLLVPAVTARGELPASLIAMDLYVGAAFALLLTATGLAFYRSSKLRPRTRRR